MTAIDTSTEAVERLLDGVTPGPWRGAKSYCGIVSDSPSGNDDAESVHAYGGHMVCESVMGHNRPFIAAARDLVPALLKERDEARAALAASQPADPVANAGCCQQVTVKPLEWNRHPDADHDPSCNAHYGGGQNNLAGQNEYAIYTHPCAVGYFVLDVMGYRCAEDFPSIEAAKAAAQADYEARILAALEAAPHVNETPKREHDSADVLTALPAAVAKALEDEGEA